MIRGLKLLSSLIIMSVVFAAPAWAGVLATDNFNRADTGGTQVEQLGSPTGNWTTNVSAHFLKVLTNAAQIIDPGSDGGERYSGITWPADQYAQVKLPVTTADAGAGRGHGPACRWDTGGAHTGYRLVMNASGYELCRMVAGACSGSGASLSTGTGTKALGGETIRVECTGTGGTVTLRMFKDTVQFGGDISDSSANRILSGAAGIGFSSTSGATANLDDFQGGSFTSGGSRMPILFP